jgi:hypothetical protein
MVYTYIHYSKTIIIIRINVFLGWNQTWDQSLSKGDNRKIWKKKNYKSKHRPKSKIERDMKMLCKPSQQTKPIKTSA